MRGDICTCGRTVKKRNGTKCYPCLAVANREWKRALRVEVVAAYGDACVCCGESEPVFLCIDHVSGGGNEHREKFTGYTVFYSWLKRNGYPPEFRLLCWNCNGGRQLNGGICPHQESALRVVGGM